MRPALLVWALAALSTTITAIPAGKDNVIAKEAQEGESSAESGEGVDYTIFNGIKVPPMIEIEGDKFKETIREGTWWIKFYSPYCGHCKAVAPAWQTLYEFYATSDPLRGRTTDGQPDLNSPNSFHGYYNFHIASMNCVTNGDACQEIGIAAYPTFHLYKNGVFVEKYTDGRTVKELSAYVEEKLEQIKPGSRPPAGVKVPDAGAKEFVDKTIPEAPARPTDKPLSAETAKAGRIPLTKAGPAPNPQGTSIPLTAETFQKLVTTSQDPWFVKFYAPWCQHCQHLAPTWSQMSKELKGKLNVGEVNCEVESRLCKDARVSAYPTIHFFRGGERVEFEGLRGLGDLLSFANKALDSDVKYVDAQAFQEMEKVEDVIFTYFFDDATTSEDFLALDRLTLSLIGHAKIVKTDSQELAKRFKIHTWPKLLVSRSGRPSYYTALAPHEMRDFRKVLSWMQSVWLPIVPELTASNARELMNGKFTVLGILSRDRPDQFSESKNELKSAALEWMDKQTLQFQLERQELRDSKQLRIEEAEDRDDQRALKQAKSRVISINEDDFRKQVRFAWVDGVFWERWLRTTYGVDVANGERVIIADEENRRYWDVTETGNPIVPSRTSILETLTRVVHNPPKLTSKSTVSFLENIFFRIRNMGTYHPWFSCGILLAAVGLLLYILRNGSSLKSMRSGSNGGYFRLDEKNGLLGGNNGKKE